MFSVLLPWESASPMAPSSLAVSWLLGGEELHPRVRLRAQPCGTSSSSPELPATPLLPLSSLPVCSDRTDPPSQAVSNTDPADQMAPSPGPCQAAGLTVSPRGLLCLRSDPQGCHPFHEVQHCSELGPLFWCQPGMSRSPVPLV